ncbi:MAG: diguanylate cyclase [Burkholderiaceae bacterium]
MGRRPRRRAATASHCWPGGLPLRVFVLLGMAVMLAALVAAPAHAQLQRAIMLDAGSSHVDLWPQVRILSDPGKDMDIEQVLRRDTAFSVPTTAARTLGLREEAVWLRIPVTAAPDAGGLWVLDIDYPVINRVDIFLVADGQVVTRGRSGNLTPPHERMVNARSIAMGLTLSPGTDYRLYLRVENTGAMILPISLSRPSEFLGRALREQMLQGILLGLGLCLLVYSVGQWTLLREPLFIKYALLISGSVLFSLLQFGVGAQFVWPGNRWLELHMGGLSALVAATGSFLFIEQVLAGKDMGPGLSRLMKLGAVLTTASALLYALDIISVQQVTLIVSVLGLAPAMLGLPGAWRRARRGDPVGHSFLLAWAVYAVSTWTLIAVIKGQVGANFWTLHAFQFGATLDMLIFMRVLGLQTRALKLAAQAARLERDNLHSMAHTDPLTGLPNRRMLNSAVSTAINQRRPDELVAVYMLDLDGFKQVNDEYGHDTGDALLVEVAHRLQASLRSSDMVSRLGGDEFLVLSSGMKTETQVRELAEKLVKALADPIVVAGHACQVGLTIGYGIAPDDGLDPLTLIQRADAAMYAGKKAGKGQVGFAGRDIAMPA